MRKSGRSNLGSGAESSGIDLRGEYTQQPAVVSLPRGRRHEAESPSTQSTSSSLRSAYLIYAALTACFSLMGLAYVAWVSRGSSFPIAEGRPRHPKVWCDVGVSGS